MKMFITSGKKQMSMLLIFTIIFSLFSGISVVNAEPTVLSIKYERVRENTLSGPTETNRLLIYGNGFLNPKVKAGQVSEIPIPINTALSTADVIVVDDQTALDSMEGIINNISIMNDGTEPIIVTGGIILDLTSIPTITNTSKSKVYINESLDIDGMFFDGLVPTSDELFIAGTKYSFTDTANVKIDDENNKINISGVKSPINTGISDVTIIRKLGGSPMYQIISTLKKSITVVDKLKNIEIERIDPNTGPRTKRNLVNIYGKEGLSNFNGNMRIFVNGFEGANKGTITNLSGTVIGLSVELPTSSVAGSADITLTNSDLSSDFVIPSGFIYLDIGNTLTIDSDGINPNYKKETEVKPITITGRNVGYFDPANYDKLSNITSPTDGLIGYDTYNNIPQFNNIDTYKVAYKGVYDNSKAVTIMKQINVFIDGKATIMDTPSPTFTKSKDTIVVLPADVTLDPKQPKAVDVTIKTTTMVFDETNPSNITIYYSRSEEYTINNGFTYIPNEITPTITSITPEYGPTDKEIYMTIKGFNFQVMEIDGVVTQPSITIGGKAAIDVAVYDSQNKIVDGKKIPVGTKIKLKLPAGQSLNGVKDVVVKNPSQGQFTIINGFEFRNPNRLPERLPKIISVKESFADMRGGLLTGQTVTITGENFDTALESNHRVIITIDGDKAEIEGKVSADGKTVTVIPPAGTKPGETKLQLINEDGSMTSAFFEYRMAVTSPKILKITPIKGGKGTQLVIKGEDFVFPDLSTNHDDPKHKGTVVLLGGKELNAYNYDSQGGIISDGTDIYYNNATLDGKMAEVQDGTTIYVDIPDKFYSFDSASGAIAPYLKSENIPLGNLSVEILNPDGARSKENIIFTYLKPATYPTITTIDPASGSINGGTIVTVKGSNFKQDELKVFFGSETASEVQFINSTEIKVKVPIYPYDLPQGEDNIKIPVMVMNYDGGMAVAEEGFEYRIPGSQPVISSLSPARGSAAGNEEVIIRGRDFRRNPDDSSMIPKVYFNGIEADVDWLGTENVSELLLVTTPSSKIDGPVDVVIVNYDSGSYTYKSFNYEISKPMINSVIPNNINKLGGNKLQINGSGFKKTDLSVLLNGEYVDRHIVSNKKASDQIDTLVIFGDATTSDKKTIDTVMGLPYVDLGDLRVSYSRVNASTANIKIAKTSSPSTYIKDMNISVGSEHMFIINGPQDLGDTTIGDEGILVEVTPNQIIATRRISTYAKWENDGLQVTAISPAVGGIGTRNLYIQNADGGIGSYSINVLNPASNPTITYISPRNKVKKEDKIVDYVSEDVNADQEYYTYTPLNGGAFITINGTDFRKNVKVYLDNKELEILSRSLNDDQLVVKVPSGTEADLDKLYRILVVNEDGGSADSSALSKPHYIVYKMPQSAPVIESVIPGFTSSTGQNKVLIIGNDFREGAKVFIDGVESKSVTLINYKELAVTIPLGLTPGKKLVQVMNPDYGFGEKKDALTIISSPRIDTVYDNTKNKVLSPVLFSIDGNQNIKLLGADFLSGAKVIIGGTLKPKSELEAGETGIKCYNIHDVEMVIVGGTVASNVKIINSTTLTFTTPKLKVGSYNIIVVNSDGGVSNETETSYQKPIPDTPTEINVEVVDSDTIKLEWEKLPETNHYEIYASYSYKGTTINNYVYVGSVDPYEVSEGRLRYFVDGLKASSWYSFKLKSVNSYGPSSLSPATVYVETKATKLTETYYQTEDEYKSGIAQVDKVDIMGSSLTYTAGEKSLSDYKSGLVVYLNQSSYNNYNPKNVDIAINLLKVYPNNSITIYEKDFTIKMLSNALLVAETRTIPKEKLIDSKMTVAINKDLRAKGDEIKIKVPIGYKAISAPAAINVTMQVELIKTSIKALNGSADISYKVADEVIRKYPGGIYIAYYNNSTKKLEILKSISSNNTITAKSNRPGEYILIGKYIK